VGLFCRATRKGINLLNRDSLKKKETTQDKLFATVKRYASYMIFEVHQKGCLKGKTQFIIMPYA
jgi:hypothetical protein